MSTENYRKAIKEMIPEAVNDGKIDLDLLLEALELDSYSLQWRGRKQSKKEAKGDPKAGLCLKEKSSGKDVLIRGDNLDALKILRRNFKNKIDCIYIDPPYNTGKKFTYVDNFRRSDAKGSHPGRGIHDEWLSMIFPRLQIAWELLNLGGCIFISIGDDEIHNLRILLDEIFGPENFIGIFSWVKKKKGSHLSSTIRSMTEHIICFAKDRKSTNLYGEPAYSDKWQPLMKKQNRRKTLIFKAGTVETKMKDGVVDSTSNPYLKFSDNLTVKSGRVINDFSVEGPFVWTQTKLDEELKLGTRASISSRLGFNVFRHNQSSKFKRPCSLLDKNCGVGSYEDAFAELRAHLGAEYKFTYAKPTSLLKYLLRAATHFRPNALVLDFFAGSGGFGEAVWQLNTEDGGQRRFVLVQREEKIQDQRFETIADICQARLNSASENHHSVGINVYSVDKEKGLKMLPFFDESEKPG